MFDMVDDGRHEILHLLILLLKGTYQVNVLVILSRPIHI